MAEIEDKQVKEYKGKKFGEMVLAKDVRETIGDLEERQAEIDDKAQNKSMWASVGKFVGGIGALALGPVGWGATALYAGAGALVGGTVGAMGADAVKGKLGNIKRLEGSLFSKSKDSQKSSVDAVNKGIQNKIIKDSLTSAAFAGFTTGGGAALGGKLKEMGVSDTITDSKFFTTMGGSDKGNTMFGKKVTPSASVTIKGSPTAYVSDNLPYGDVKQASLDNALPNTSSSTTASNFKGTASQNTFIASKKGMVKIVVLQLETDIFLI